VTDQPRYPALIVGWLTPGYDLFARLCIPATKLKRDLIARAKLKPGQRLLDVGAGTGTLAIMIKRDQPDVQVTGLDSDAEILTIARQKAARAGVDVTFELGTASPLPNPNASFDRVLSSLVFFLLSQDDKRGAVREAYRVLRCDAELHIADFGPPNTRWGHWVSPLVLRFEPIAGNLEGRLPAMLREAGFENVEAAPRWEPSSARYGLCPAKSQRDRRPSVNQAVAIRVEGSDGKWRRGHAG
jgi:ubiquinone/menaquinone biosynthesis C-methylase UbiE